APSTVVTGWWGAPKPVAVKKAEGGPAVGRMTVKWAKVTDEGGRPVLGWLYDVRTDNAGAWLGPTPLTGGAPTTLSTTLPCPSTNAAGGCAYRVYARNSIGASAPGAAIYGRWKLPSAPLFGGVVPGRPADSATIDWGPPGDSGGLPVSYLYEVR